MLKKIKSWLLVLIMRVFAVEIVEVDRRGEISDNMVSGWLNVYPDGLTSSYLFATKEEANREAHEERLGEAKFIEHHY